MSDQFDDRMRELARAARAETEAALDIDDIDDALDDVQRSNGAAVVVPGRPRHRRLVGWLTAAAALTFALSAGILFTRGTDDGVVTTNTDEPISAPISAATTMPVPTTSPTTVPATTGPTSSPTTIAPASSAPAVTTTAPPSDQAVPVVEWRDLRWEASSIDRSCPTGASDCTQLVYGTDGTPITYDPTTRELTRHSTTPVTATLPAAYGGGYVLHPGTLDVVYLGVAPAEPDPDGLAADVVAVTLAEGDAGREIGRWSDVTDNVGDSELVATEAGLVNVNCCGPDEVRPAPDADVLVPWLDLEGETVALDAPTFRVEIDFPTLVVHRDDPLTGTTRTWTYQPAGEWQPRGMPALTATFDGGFLATEFGGQGYSIARGYPDGRLDQIVVDDVLYVGPVDPAGRFEVADVAEIDGRFARVDPFPDGSATWDGRAQIDIGGTGAIELPGIDEAVDADPTWDANPVEFAAAVAGSPAVNEERTIEATQSWEYGWQVDVTTSNLFDDSVQAVRWRLDLSRSDVDGTFRFESGQWSQTCQPGRGQQDFSTELCI